MSFKKPNLKFFRNFALACFAAGLSGCSLLHEDLPECEALLKVRFIFDYNLNFADAFPYAVKSVNVWAFDYDGKLVWSGSASGEVLKENDFAFDTTLGEGTYDFVAWCGLENNDDFNLATYTPASMEELEVKLKTIEEDGRNISRSHLPGLFHGRAMQQTFTVNSDNPSLKTVTIPLMKDTNDIRVLLQRYDGSPIGENDFDVDIKIANAWLGWNNDLLPDNPEVTYSWWGQRFGQITVNDQMKAAGNVISGIVYELSSSRLLATSEAILTVTRNSDGKAIIEVPIIDYFLMVQGHYVNPDGTPLTDQQYLDRQDDYSIIFFLDKKNEWYVGAGIYINSWAVVPPQKDTL